MDVTTFVGILIICSIFGIVNILYTEFLFSKFKKEIYKEKTVNNLVDLFQEYSNNEMKDKKDELKRKIENAFL